MKRFRIDSESDGGLSLSEWGSPADAMRMGASGFFAQLSLVNPNSKLTLYHVQEFKLKRDLEFVLATRDRQFPNLV